MPAARPMGQRRRAGARAAREGPRSAPAVGCASHPGGQYRTPPLAPPHCAQGAWRRAACGAGGRAAAAGGHRPRGLQLHPKGGGQGRLPAHPQRRQRPGGGLARGGAGCTAGRRGGTPAAAMARKVRAWAGRGWAAEAGPGRHHDPRRPALRAMPPRPATPAGAAARGVAGAGEQRAAGAHRLCAGHLHRGRPGLQPVPAQGSGACGGAACSRADVTCSAARTSWPAQHSVRCSARRAAARTALGSRAGGDAGSCRQAGQSLGLQGCAPGLAAPRLPGNAPARQAPPAWPPPHCPQIQEGSDADVVIFDPAVEHTLSAAAHHSAMDTNIYEGYRVRGKVRGWSGCVARGASWACGGRGGRAVARGAAACRRSGPAHKRAAAPTLRRPPARRW